MEAEAWKDFSTLRKIDADLSWGRCSREYALAHHWFDKLKIFAENGDGSKIVFNDPYEVKLQDGRVLYREAYNFDHQSPESFDTQLGRFQNYDHGEFGGHLQRKKFKLGGNFVDVFDFGDYVYAVSNSMHLGLGAFSLYQIDKKLKATCLYATKCFDLEVAETFQYLGRSEDADSVKLYLSGDVRYFAEAEIPQPHDKSKILEVKRDGSFAVAKEYDYEFGSANSVARIGNRLYLGRNYMVSVVDLETGEKEFYTDKPADAVEELTKYKW